MALISSCGKIAHMKLIYFFLSVNFFYCSIYADHYPENKNNPRPCSQIGYTIRFQGKICVPNGYDSFTEESENNCNNAFKKECPEFNEASCGWHTLKCNNVSLTFPVCKLKYYAKHKLFPFTWISIAYTNQFGSLDGDNPKSILTILELHREIKLHEVFSNKEQGDWPGNVPSSKGIQGLAWAPITGNVCNVSGNICNKGIDQGSVCGKKIKDAMLQRYKTVGIGDYKGTLAGVEASGQCEKYIIDNVKRDVCRVRFTNSIFPNDGGWLYTQTVAEIQAFSNGGKCHLQEAVYGGNSINSNGTFVH